eukprot:CAMPEP_0174828122 /NCGR_PEP_ID=MMETSP1114-20130205/1145_1 /TAXON_ID=312471 /ORGANISM="Neobodo designis, Strain CCAP 1951/1" /LENGTH=429 /DNA_ID=CAMNT_0016061831 /DNA_START=280 /DNA_END=1571 /DNA_ORIENTATION=+
MAFGPFGVLRDSLLTPTPPFFQLGENNIGAMPPVLNARLRFLVLAHAIANRESIAVMTGACRRRQLGHLDALFNRLCEGAAVRSPPSRTTYLVIRRLFFNFCRSTSRSRFAEANRFDGRTLVNPRTRARISTALPSLAIAAAIATGRSLASSWNGRRHTVPPNDRPVRARRALCEAEPLLADLDHARLPPDAASPPRAAAMNTTTTPTPPNLGRNAAFRPAAAISAATCGRVCGCAALRSHTHDSGRTPRQAPSFYISEYGRRRFQASQLVARHPFVTRRRQQVSRSACARSKEGYSSFCHPPRPVPLEPAACRRPTDDGDCRTPQASGHVTKASPLTPTHSARAPARLMVSLLGRLASRRRAYTLDAVVLKDDTWRIAPRRCIVLRRRASSCRRFPARVRGRRMSSVVRALGTDLHAPEVLRAARART